MSVWLSPEEYRRLQSLYPEQTAGMPEGKEPGAALDPMLRLDQPMTPATTTDALLGGFGDQNRAAKANPFVQALQTPPRPIPVPVAAAEPARVATPMTVTPAPVEPAPVRAATPAGWTLAQAFPADNAAAGLPPADRIVNNYISSVAVKDGAIHITFGNRASGTIRGKVLSLRPATVDDAPVVPVTWVCGYAGPPAKMTVKGENRTNIPTNFLPFICRAA